MSSQRFRISKSQTSCLRAALWHFTCLVLLTPRREGNILRLFRLTLIGWLCAGLSACGGGGSSSGSSATSAAPPSAPTVTSVSVSGKLTYDRVPHTQDSTLDYANTAALPIRGVIVEAVDAAEQVIASAMSDEDGDYRLSLDADTDIRLRVKAQLLSTADASWDVKITDNTDNDALYALQGSLASTGNRAAQTRDLHAAHGWTGQSYGETRSAAPFAILDNIYTAIQSFAAVDPNIDFPELEVHWSTRNRSAFGNLSDGSIGSSAYHRDGDSGAIFILGQENVDTDEYDQHIIIHEWGHYFEHQMSRADTIGGPHSLSDRLDPRVAFSEGWGNALSAIITGDPIYRDSSGPEQGTGFTYDVEAEEIDQPGWFTEASIGAIVYEVFNRNSNGVNDIASGLAPLYTVMRNETYRTSPVFTTIFAFADGLRDEGSLSSGDVDALLEAHSISGVGANGSGEINNGAIQSALPVYKEVGLNGDAVQFCSLDDAGIFNKLGNRDFTFLTLPQDMDVTISVTKVSGREDRDPDFNIWQAGELLHSVSTVSVNEDSFQGHLTAGDYIIEAFDSFNVSGTFVQRGDSCYDLTVDG